MRDNDRFLQFVREHVTTTGEVDAALAPDALTEAEFVAPPADTEIALYEAWKALRPRTTCRSTFWAHLARRHVESGHIKSSYLAANGGSLGGGAARIDRALSAPAAEAPRVLDGCVRSVLRRLGGLPEVRGNRSVYVDCPFARAWWRGHFVAQVAGADAALAKEIRALVRTNQTYWEKLIDRIVSRNSTFGAEEVRTAFIGSLARLVSQSPDTSLRKPMGLEQATQQVAAYQGVRELSVLHEIDLLQIMDDIVRSI